MSGNELDRFFEQTLAEPESVEDPAIPTARRALGATLPPVPDEIYEAEAAQCFLDRVAAEKSPAPPDLIAAVTAEFTHRMRNPAVTGPGKRVVPMWGWVAGAMAASVLVILAGARLGHYAAPIVSVTPASMVASLQGPVKSNIANAVLPPPPPMTSQQRSGALIDGNGFNNVVSPPPPPAPARPKGAPEPVYTAPNPPRALTSHAVTAADYPTDSVRLLEQGTVTLQYTIGTGGAVSNCTVTMTSGFPRLDEAACVLVQKWTFKPATVIGGAPVAFIIPAQIVFALAPVPSVSPALNGQAQRDVPSRQSSNAGSPPIALTSHAVTADDYPPDSIRLAEQGRVQIKYTIGPDGRVILCGVTMSSGVPRLDKAACDMVAGKWKFKPATQDGRAVAVSIPAEIIFALK